MSERTRTGDGEIQPIIQEDDGVLDEFVLHDCTVHFEAMSENDWWIGIDKDGHHWAIRCGSTNPRAGAYAHVEDDGLYVPDPNYERDLPTRRGAMIGWSTWYDDNLYGGAVLDHSSDRTGELSWYVLGTGGEWSPAELKEKIGNGWQMMGQIAPARDYSTSTQ